MEYTEFFMVAPSNASPRSQPNNSASHFTIDLECPIRLGAGRWKVALTEMNYCHDLTTLMHEFGIKYGKYERKEQEYSQVLMVSKSADGLFSIAENVLHLVPGSAKEIGGDIRVSINKNNGSLTYAAAVCFSVFTGFRHGVLEEISKYDAVHNVFTLESNLDMDPLINWRDKYPQTRINGIIILNLKLYFKIYWFVNKERTVMFNHEKRVRDVDDLVYHMTHNSRYGFLFEGFNVNNGFTSFELGDRVYYINLLGGLNILFGFPHQTEFRTWEENKIKMGRDVDLPTCNPRFTATSPFLMRHNIQQFRVFSSVCKPSIIGGRRLPLLKSVFTNTSLKIKADPNFQTQHIEFAVPKYADVIHDEISQLSFSIQKPNGNLMAFPNGSVTVLTLHFRNDL